MRRRRARNGLLALALAAVALPAGAQLAQAVSVDDPKDAPGSKFDIRRVSGVQSKVSNKISQQIRFHTSTANALGAVCLGIYKSKATANPSHTICVDYEGLTNPNQNDSQDPNIVRCPPLKNGDFDSPTVCGGKKSGEADVSYGLTGLKLTFKPKAIGSPDAYYFAARSRAFVETGPPPGQFCCTDTTSRKKLELKK